MTSTAVCVDGRYRLRRLIGQGGMSVVYEAVDERCGDIVALKLVRPGDPELARRLAQEVQVLARLAHPGLVHLLDAGLAGEQTYLVMELVDGQSLSAVLRDAPLVTADAAHLGAVLADALAYVHAQGVVHRDVKPSNILLSSGRRVQLCDFGVSRLLDASTMTMAGTTIGTVAYMAPEQLGDHQVGPPADIWSLGIVLLECLTGRRVYEGGPQEVVARRLAGPVPIPVDLPAPWRLLLSGMLDHRPDQRLCGAEVASLLASAPFATPWDPSHHPAAGATTTPVSPGRSTPLPVPVTGAPSGATRAVGFVPPVTPPPRRHRRRMLAAAAAVVLGCAAVGLVFGLGLLPRSPGGRAPSATSPPRPTAASRTTGTTAPPTTAAPTTTPPATTVPPTSTTTLAPAPAALASLDQDLATAVAAGGIDPGTAQTVSNQAEQAVTDEAAGDPSQAVMDLNQATTALAHAIANGVDNGQTTTATGQTLQNDLATLATTLGLGGAIDTTPPSSGPGGGPGHGKGHGGAGGP